MPDGVGEMFEPTDDGGLGVMVAFGMCGPLVVEEFDDEVLSRSSEEARGVGNLESRKREEHGS
ncbi:MAG: hypothetical protein ACRDSJ_16515 [Rubrobacteraceae bacterium]